QVSTLPDPSVMFMYFVNPDQYSNPFNHSAISVMQKFPWFGTLKAAENRVKQSAKAKRAAVINARNELFRNIKKVWFQMYKMHHHIKIMKENLELLQSLKSQALSLYETGENSQVDILRLQMETDKMKTRLRQTKEKLKPLRSQFNNLLNRDTDAEIKLSFPMKHNTLAFAPQQLLEKVKAESPKLAKLDFRKESAEYTLKKAHLDGLPSFSIGAEAMFPDRSEEHTSELQSRFDLVCRLLLEKKK